MSEGKIKLDETLTVENAERLHSIINAMLTGRTFTVATSEEGEWISESLRVLVDQELAGPVRLYLQPDRAVLKVVISSLYDYMFVSRQLNAGYDHGYSSPYIVIKENTIKIINRTSAGELVNTQFVIQHCEGVGDNHD